MFTVLKYDQKDITICKNQKINNESMYSRITRSNTLDTVGRPC